MKKFIILIFTTFTTIGTFGQTPTVPQEGTTITQAVPPSADAAALGKYGRVPVSAFTGIPNISIPLYTIKSGDLTLPISLTYHAGGIKVEEIASSAGLGWVLNAGGAITRTVRGLPDESTYGYLDPANNVYDIYHALISQPSPISFTSAGQQLNYYVDGIRDGEADIFNFNFAGYTGQFEFSPTAGIMVSPQQNIKITCGYSINSPIYSFIAETPDGIKYYFGSNNGIDAVESTNTGAAGGHSKIYNTSWMLARIVSPSGSEIDFTYSPYSYSQTQPGGTHYRLIAGTGTDIGMQNQLRTDNDYSSASSIHAMQLTNISFQNGNLNVYSNVKRLDNGGKMIDSILISSTGYNKLYQFYHLNTASTRLKLDSLIGRLDPDNPNSNSKREKYSFAYEGDPWSTDSKFQNAQDWWGFWNGQNQTTIVPWEYDPLQSSQKLPGAERRPDASSMTAGILTAIRYPTGGYTYFTFEPNQQPGYDFGADSYYSDPQVTAIGNDPSNPYNNYDNRNGNPNNLMHIYSQLNPNANMPVHLVAYGLRNGYHVPPIQEKVSAYLYAKDAQGNYTINAYEISDTDTTIYLPQGYYQLVFKDILGVTNPQPGENLLLYSVVANWSNHLYALAQTYHGHTTGGLRISKIVDYDGLSNRPFNTRTYKYNLNDTTSSGFMNFKPEFSYNLTINSGSFNTFATSTYYVRTAGSNYPLATQQGAVVGYYHVEEDIENNAGQGKNEYFYSINGNGAQIGGFPFAPPTTMDWLSGLLTREIKWKHLANGTYSKIQETANVYKTMRSDSCISIKAGFNPYPSNYDENLSYYGGTQAGTGGTSGIMIAQPYLNATNFNYLSSDTTWAYDVNNQTKAVKTWNTYQYDPTMLFLRSVKSVNSRKELITQNISYSADGTGVRGASFLYGSGIDNYPIEEVTYKSNLDGSNNRAVKAILTSYKPNKPYRDSVFELRSVVPPTDFTPARSGMKRDARYQPVVSFDRYDLAGNISQERRYGDAIHSYLWGYMSHNRNTYPIAEVINADSANIAYTNFESYDTNGLGNWIYSNSNVTSNANAPMGGACFTVGSGATLVKSGLTSSTTYTVSFWANSSGTSVTVAGGTVTNIATGKARAGWYYHEYNVTGTNSVTISGSGLIDEVRLYPADAQMNTYTYIPLVGIASKCNAKNEITHYNFDLVGRLTQVQDLNRNITKDYQYNYITQGPIWVDNSITQCLKDVYGNNTGEEQMQQTDRNPYSNSYGSTQWRSMGQQPGACPPPLVYVKMQLTSTFTHEGITTNHYEIDLYSNSLCTVPLTLSSNININYSQTTTSTTPANQVTVIHTAVVPANTGTVSISVNMNDCSPTGGTGCNSTIGLAPGSGYITFAQANE